MGLLGQRHVDHLAILVPGPLAEFGSTLEKDLSEGMVNVPLLSLWQIHVSSHVFRLIH